MPTEFVLKLVLKILAFLLPVAAGFALAVYLMNPSATQTGGVPPTPGINTTAIAQITLTPGSSSNQMATMVYAAKPTPFVKWSPPDAEAFRLAIQRFVSTTTFDYRVVASYEGPGVGLACTYARLGDTKMPDFTSGAMDAIYAEMSAGVHVQDAIVDIKPGKVITGYHDDGTNPPFIELRQMAIVTMSFPKWGIVGPVIRPSNEYLFTTYEPNGIYKVIITVFRDPMKNDDFLNSKQSEANNIAMQLAKADFFAPLQPDGSRSTAKLFLLYEKMMESFTQPSKITGQNNAYDNLMKEVVTAAKAAGYVGVESLTVTIPKPVGLEDFVYIDNLTSPVIPGTLPKPEDYICPDSFPTGLKTKIYSEIIPPELIIRSAEVINNGIKK